MLSREADVGITQYLNPDNVGFKGKVKERFSDFNVTEIDPGGQIVKLNSDKQSFASEMQDSKSDVELSYENLEENLKKIISKQDYDKIIQMSKGDLEQFDIVVDNFSKEERKMVHTVCKTFSLNSNTLTNEKNEKIIKLMKCSNKKSSSRGGINHGERGRSKAEKFLHFSLYKENATTSEVISQIAQQIRTKDRYFTFAGSKDRRGRTLQRVAVSLIKSETIEATVKKLRCPAAVGNYSFHPEGLRLGDLSGNNFEVGIKDVEIDCNTLNDTMQYFKEHGFINYFGMQRFGTSEVPTHQIGLNILKKDLQGAIDLILQPRESQYSELKSVLEKYSVDKDAESAFTSLSYKMKGKIEGKLLNGLRKFHNNDKANALKFLPAGVRQMYGHAFQSYVWNLTVSRRVEKYGSCVLEGDLVLSERPVDSGSLIRKNVKKISMEDVKNEMYTIYDVVIPLPGHSSVLPNNETKDIMLQILKDDGLEMDDFRNNNRDYDLPGDYRNMITKATDVCWRLVKHDNLNDDIIHSKLEIFQNQENPGNLREIGNVEGGMKSVVMSFSLKSSCYATMALREIMRIQTDVTSMKGEANEVEDDEAVDNESEYSINQSTQSIDQPQDQNGSANGEQNGNDKRKLEHLDVDNATKKLKS